MTFFVYYIKQVDSMLSKMMPKYDTNISDTLALAFRSVQVLLFFCCNQNLMSSVISDSNWAKWSKIQGIIVRVISRSDKCEARHRFELRTRLIPELYDKRSNY